MDIELVTANAVALAFEEPWPIVTCPKCQRLGAYVAQGWFNREFCEDRVVHAVRWHADGGWSEIDVCPTTLANERLLLELLALRTPGEKHHRG
jgi:hypothetical protein